MTNKSLTELIRDANREITPADRHAILDMIEQQAARIAELSTCKLCNSTGHDAPCAYPTEINRQQAKRIAALESAAKATVPEGWKLVPVAPTDEMAGAFMDGGEYPGSFGGKPFKAGQECEWYGTRERFSLDYAAMLAAAPAALSQQGGQDD